MQTLLESSALKIIEPTQDEINILNELGEDYKEYSEMSEQDRAFLNTLVLRKQPLRLLELGVCSGGSSLVMLNAIKNIEGAHLYSIDYNTKHYNLKDKLTGFYVDNFPELKEKWTLKTGGLALNFMDEIGGDIDFCLIDTVHANPGEILDFLMILPYLKKNATVVFHDTNLHTRKGKTRKLSTAWQFTNNILMSTVTGNKLIPAESPFKANLPFVNISGIELNEDSFTHIWDVFNLLTIKWNYIPNSMDIKQLEQFILRFYGKFYQEYFNKVLANQQSIKLIDEQLAKKQETSQEKNNLPVIEEKIKKIQSNINMFYTEWKSTKLQNTFWQKIFSVKNQLNHKVITILGIKIKLKRGAKNA